MIDHLRTRLRPAAEDGFTMLLAIAAMALVTSLSVATFVAVNSDLPLAANDSQQKEAYSAAQAGIQQYLFDLNQDNGYWEQCVPTSNNHGINLNGSTANTWKVANSSTESYAIELMPAAGQTTYTQCSTTDPLDSMIQATGNGAGSLRIRSTGIVTGAQGTVTRTIVANVREGSFLDYVYFTNFETSDPILQAESITGETPSSANWDTVVGDAETQCGQYAYDGRYNSNFYGTQPCDKIYFATGDALNGPFHTNDQVEMCGTPTFGRSGDNDKIEMGGTATTGYFEGSGCSGTPTFNNNAGAPTVPGGVLPMPSADSSLKTITASSYVYTGTTCLTLGATTITVSQPNTTYPSCFSSGIPTTTVNYPTNGVLYVANSTSNPCSLTYDPDAPVYTGNTGCGTVYVSGTYGEPLTIAAENDIVIDNSLTHSGTNALLGLIADNFVRVYHPCNQSTNTNGSGSLTDPNVDAMILSLNHSFIVDNYDCGAPLGTLTVNGGIAQDFRGTVATLGGSGIGTGYAKAYDYDERLSYEEPPFFLNPTQTTWNVVREDECDPYAIPSAGLTKANTC